MRAATPLDQPRAIGQAFVSSKTGPFGSTLDGLRQSGALKLLFPKHTPRFQAIVVNTAGGITGGDAFRLQATAGAGAHLTLTTQAAERAYRAQVGQVGTVETSLTVEDGGSLYWLPQETILYDEAALHRRLSVDLAPDARFLMVEPVLFGRQAMGENATRLTFRDRVEIRRAGQPLYRDGVSLDGPVGACLDQPAIGNGARAMASLVCVDPTAAGKLDAVRCHLGAQGAASMLADGVMVLRLLAHDGFTLRTALLPVLDVLTNNSLPQSWRL